MVFASLSFLAFLAIVLLAYWLVGCSHERLGKPLLIVASFVFYGYLIPAYPACRSCSTTRLRALLRRPRPAAR